MLHENSFGAERLKCGVIEINHRIVISLIVYEKVDYVVMAIIKKSKANMLFL